MSTLEEPPPSFLRSVLNILNHLDSAIAAVITLVIFVDVVLQAATRLLPFSALPWTNELGEILLSALIWIGVSAAVRTNNHIGFDLFVSRLSPKGKKYMGMINMGLFLAYLLILAHLTWGMMQLYLRRTAYTPILGIGMYWVRMPILIGCLMASVRLIIKEYLIITDRERMYEYSLLTE
jgi:TRAP-type C4-dicarboxylate transport system permease small subunit